LAEKSVPLHAWTRRRSSSSVKTGTGPAVTLGRWSRSKGLVSTSCSTSTSHFQNCCKFRYWRLTYAVEIRCPGRLLDGRSARLAKYRVRYLWLMSTARVG